MSDLLDDFLFKACRSERFPGIDFPNSFIWGNASVTKMETPCIASDCLATNVVTGTNVVCSQVKESYKIFTMYHII